MNIWGYHKVNLWIAYGASIFVAIVANLLGAYAYKVNKVAHDISFSSLVSSTTDPSINNLFNDDDPNTRGKLPLPKKVSGVEIKFKPLDEGGLGFQTAAEIRRASSVGFALSLARAMD